MLISVIIPAYNRSTIVPQALRSVMNQTYRNIEIILVDDGSTDDTGQVAQAFIREDQRIHYVRQETNSGAQAARNSGIRAGQGEWIAFLDSDDTWLPDSLAQRFTLAQHEGVSVVHSECLVSASEQHEKLFGVPPMSGQVYRDVLCRPGPVFPSLLVTKHALHTIDLLDEQILAFQEWDTAIRLARHFAFGFVKEPTFRYNCHGHETISKNLVWDAKGYEQIVRKHTREILRVAGRQALSEHYLQIAMRYDHIDQIQIARKYKWRAILCCPRYGILLFRKLKRIILNQPSS